MRLRIGWWPLVLLLLPSAAGLLSAQAPKPTAVKQVAAKPTTVVITTAAKDPAPIAMPAKAVPAKPAVRAIPADAPIYARQGFWFGAGMGAGAATLHCRICDGAQGSKGTSGYLRAGTTVNGRLLVGAELNGWVRGDQTGNQRIFALTGNGYWYPNPLHGYYLKGGFGISSYRQRATDPNNADVSTGVSTGGFTGQVGGGYEMRINPRTSFVPYLNLVGTAAGVLYTERNDGTHFDRNRLPNRANVLLVQLGVGITWH